MRPSLSHRYRLFAETPRSSQTSVRVIRAPMIEEDTLLPGKNHIYLVRTAPRRSSGRTRMEGPTRPRMRSGMLPAMHERETIRRGRNGFLPDDPCETTTTYQGGANGDTGQEQGLLVVQRRCRRSGEILRGDVPRFLGPERVPGAGRLSIRQEGGRPHRRL